MTVLAPRLSKRFFFAQTVRHPKKSHKTTNTSFSNAKKLKELNRDYIAQEI